MKTMTDKILPFMLLFSVWEISANLLSSPFIPHLREIAEAILQTSPLLKKHTLITLREMSLSIFWATFIAMPLSLMMHHSRFFRALFQPLFLIFQSLPMFALAPLFILCFGWQEKTMIIPAVIMIVFPLTQSILRGLTATSKNYIDLFKVHNASSWTIFWQLRLPFAASHILAGIKIAAGISVSAILAGEWIAGQSGLGVYMQQCRYNFDILGLYAALFCILMITMLCFAIASFIEKTINRKMRIDEKPATPLNPYSMFFWLPSKRRKYQKL